MKIYEIAESGNTAPGFAAYLQHCKALIQPSPAHAIIAIPFSADKRPA